MKGVAACFLLALVVAQLMAGPAEAITCTDVTTCLVPCVGYLTGVQPTPAPLCCDGVRRLKTIATTTADRQFACGCMKQAAAHFQNIKDEAVSELPRLCGSPLPFPISLEVDCSKIQ